MSCIEVLVVAASEIVLNISLLLLVSYVFRGTKYRISTTNLYFKNEF